MSGLYSEPVLAQEDPARDGEPDVFMWLGGGSLFEREPEMTRNLFAFARRHRIIPYEAGAGDPALLETFLRHAKAAGVARTWIEIRPRQEETGGATAKAFANDPERRQATLARFRRLARIYKRY